jgi:hypothetical protein
VGWLLLLPALQDTADLIRQLDDDDPEVREAATFRLRNRGPRIVPQLEEALNHPSPEVRSRIEELLQAHSAYALRPMLRHVDFPLAARIWNAVVECLVQKRPVPKKFAQLFFEEERGVRVKELRKLDDSPSEPRCLVEFMIACGTDALHEINLLYGVRGEERPTRGMAKLCRALHRYDLKRALVKFGADRESFEEVYATVRILEDRYWASSLFEVGDRNWDLILRFLVHLRKRPGSPTVVLPRTELDCRRFLEQGPWMRGLADGLRRAVSHPGDRSKRIEERLKESRELPADALDEAYGLLLSLDRRISDTYFYPGVLEAAPHIRVPSLLEAIDRIEHPLVDALRRHALQIP